MKNKKILSWLLGVIIVFTMTIFSFSTVLAVMVPWDLEGAVGGYNLPGGSLADIIMVIASWLVGMFVFFGVIGFLVSGIMYLVSAGNDEMITKAKNYMMYSIVGVLVGLSGYLLIQAIDALLSAEIF